MPYVVTNSDSPESVSEYFATPITPFIPTSAVNSITSNANGVIALHDHITYASDCLDPGFISYNLQDDGWIRRTESTSFPNWRRSSRISHVYQMSRDINRQGLEIIFVYFRRWNWENQKGCWFDAISSRRGRSENWSEICVMAWWCDVLQYECTQFIHPTTPYG